MRQLCQISDHSAAKIFGDALYARGIPNAVEQEEGGYVIWIEDDDQIAEAQEAHTAWLRDPAAFAADAQKAPALRAAEEKQDRRRASRIITREKMGFNAAAGAQMTVCFMVLAFLSVIATWLAGHYGLSPSDDSFLAERLAGQRAEWRGKLFIDHPQKLSEFVVLGEAGMTKEQYVELFRVLAEMENAGEQSVENSREKVMAVLDRHGRDWRLKHGLQAVRSGEIWRLITPIFIHFGLIHLIFNLMWLREFSTFIEDRFTVWYVLALIAVSAVISNVLQYWWSGPSFGGLSGINYALFGFLLARSKTDRTVLWSLRPGITAQLLVWLVVCMTGALGPVANMAHVAGLAVGLVWGGATGLYRSRRGFR